MPIYNLSAWVPSASYGKSLASSASQNPIVLTVYSCGMATDSSPSSSAKDQLTGQAVAVKKIMKPFSTPVLAKRTYRELKLLKHLRHENVGLSEPATVHHWSTSLKNANPVLPRK